MFSLNYNGRRQCQWSLCVHLKARITRITKRFRGKECRAKFLRKELVEHWLQRILNLTVCLAVDTSPSCLAEMLLSLNSRARPARGPIRESKTNFRINDRTVRRRGRIYGSFFVIPASTAIPPPFSPSSEPETRRHQL